MADYIEPWVDQMQKWLENGSLLSHTQNPEFRKFLGNDCLTFKMTIEPCKPRLCINARALASTTKNMPCHLDQIEGLLPYLSSDSRAIISDDACGFLHVFLHPMSQCLAGVHLGEEHFNFTVSLQQFE